MNTGEAEPAGDPSPVFGLTEAQLWSIAESKATTEIKKALTPM